MQKFNDAAKCQFATASFQIIQGDYGAGRKLPRNHAGEVGADKPGAAGYQESQVRPVPRHRITGP